jgi:hypothetical protein
MLMTYDKASALIHDGKLLHIAGTEDLLKKLPKGNWIGGSTEYFMAREGGRVSGNLLFVTELPYERFTLKSYTDDEIAAVASDAFDSGFSIVIVPFDSAVHKSYAQNAAGFKDMFIKNIAGWVAGVNIGIPGQTPVAVDGMTGNAYPDRAVALHLEVPADKTVSINILNIFSQDESSPVIEFLEEGFSADKCLVDGTEVVLADYIAQKGIDSKLPLVGDYSGNGVNISFKSIVDGKVNFYAPVFRGIKYRMARSISDYSKEFGSRLTGIGDTGAAFSCNCILNFLYGELEGKSIPIFTGPVTFGEIAYQLVNQTLVYVTVE